MLFFDPLYTIGFKENLNQLDWNPQVKAIQKPARGNQYISVTKLHISSRAKGDISFKGLSDVS